MFLTIFGPMKSTDPLSYKTVPNAAMHLDPKDPYNIIARVVSYIFHPALIPTYVAFLLVWVQQKEYVQMFTERDVNSWLFNIFLSTFFFPVIFVLLLRALKFIDSIHLNDAKSRIVPLIGAMIFYFWCNEIFRNIETNFFIKAYVLGSFWGIIVVFLTNIILKVSMHTSAMGGAIGMAILQLIIYPSLMNLLIFLAVLLLAGIVGTSRLHLKAHSPKELWIGYALGIGVQIMAYVFLVYIF